MWHSGESQDATAYRRVYIEDINEATNIKTGRTRNVAIWSNCPILTSNSTLQSIVASEIKKFVTHLAISKVCIHEEQVKILREMPTMLRHFLLEEIEHSRQKMITQRSAGIRQLLTCRNKPIV